MTPSVPADWIGFDFVAVNKRVKIGESIKITAYITPQRTTQLDKAYLMFKMQASGEGGTPTTTGIVKSQLIFPIQPVTVNVVSQSPTQPTPTPTSTPKCLSDSDCMWCGQECVEKQLNLICPAIAPPSNCECVCLEGECTKVCTSPTPTMPTITTTTPPTQTPTPTPTPPSQLEELSVSIDPKYVEAKLGDTVNYTITIDWYPPEWRGEMTISAVISAAGFEKRYELPSVAPSSVPPITTQIPIPIPEAIPPLTYEVRVEAIADSLKASDDAVLKISQSTPGFEVLFAIAGLLTVAYLLRRH